MANGPRRGGGQERSSLRIAKSEWRSEKGILTLHLSLSAMKGSQPIQGQISGSVFGVPVSLRTASSGSTALDPLPVSLLTSSGKVNLTLTGDDGDVQTLNTDLTVQQPTNAIGVRVIARDLPLGDDLFVAVGVQIYSQTRLPLMGKACEVSVDGFFSRQLVTDANGEVQTTFGPVTAGQFILVKVTTPENGVQSIPFTVKEKSARQLGYDIVENPGEDNFTLTIVVSDAEKNTPASEVDVYFRVGNTFQGPVQTNAIGQVTSQVFEYVPDGDFTNYVVRVVGGRTRNSSIRRPRPRVDNETESHVEAGPGAPITGFRSAFRASKERKSRRV